METTQLFPCPGSFRDPSGKVFTYEGSIFRSIDASYARHWTAATESGFLADASDKGMLQPFEEVSPELAGSWKLLKLKKFPLSVIRMSGVSASSGPLLCTHSMCWTKRLNFQ